MNLKLFFLLSAIGISATFVAGYLSIAYATGVAPADSN